MRVCDPSAPACPAPAAAPAAKLLNAFRDTVETYRRDGLVYRTAVAGEPKAGIRGMGCARAFFCTIELRESCPVCALVFIPLTCAALFLCSFANKEMMSKYDPDLVRAGASAVEVASRTPSGSSLGWRCARACGVAVVACSKVGAFGGGWEGSKCGVFRPAKPPSVCRPPAAWLPLWLQAEQTPEEASALVRPAGMWLVLTVQLTGLRQTTTISREEDGQVVAELE